MTERTLQDRLFHFKTTINANAIPMTVSVKHIQYNTLNIMRKYLMAAQAVLICGLSSPLDEINMLLVMLLIKNMRKSSILSLKAGLLK